MQAANAVGELFRIRIRKAMPEWARESDEELEQQADQAKERFKSAGKRAGEDFHGALSDALAKFQATDIESAATRGYRDALNALRGDIDRAANEAIVSRVPWLAEWPEQASSQMEGLNQQTKEYAEELGKAEKHAEGIQGALTGSADFYRLVSAYREKVMEGWTIAERGGKLNMLPGVGPGRPGAAADVALNTKRQTMLLEEIRNAILNQRGAIVEDAELGEP